MQNSNNHLGNCHGCKYFDPGGEEYGHYQPATCGKTTELYEDGECSEQVAILLESMMFALSGMNNCPGYETSRKSILDIRR